MKTYIVFFRSIEGCPYIQAICDSLQTNGLNLSIVDFFDDIAVRMEKFQHEGNSVPLTPEFRKMGASTVRNMTMKDAFKPPNERKNIVIMQTKFLIKLFLKNFIKESHGGSFNPMNVHGTLDEEYSYQSMHYNFQIYYVYVCF